MSNTRCASIILVVVNDPAARRTLEDAVLRCGHRSRGASDGEEALAEMGSVRFDAILFDPCLPGLDGLGLLTRLRSQGDTTPTIVRSDDPGTISAAMHAGADDFIPVNTDDTRLAVSVLNAVRLRGALDRAHADHGTFDEATPAALAALVKRAVASGLPVLLEGERGTGKETLARRIHEGSDRTRFTVVRCGETATGIDDLSCARTTIFLDEADRLSHEAQTSLLNALPTAEARVVTSSGYDLIEAVRRGRFREDLYYRLAVFPIALPPLREREDLDLIIDRTFRAARARQGRRIRDIEPSAFAALVAHRWPGNLRELESVMCRAVLLSEGDRLAPHDFPGLIAAEYPTRREIDHSPTPAAPDRPALNRDGLCTDLADAGGRPRSMAAIEADAIRFAVAHNKGRLTPAARDLGIGRSTLYRKLKEHGLEGLSGSSARSFARISRATEENRCESVSVT